MNLIEALKTGRPLRRPIAKHMGSGKDGWLGNDFMKKMILSESNACHEDWKNYGVEVLVLREDDLLADDWEVEAKEDPPNIAMLAGFALRNAVWPFRGNDPIYAAIRNFDATMEILTKQNPCEHNALSKANNANINVAYCGKCGANLKAKWEVEG